MGLDVYLYRYENHAATVAIEERAEAESERVWAEVRAGREYDALSEGDKDAARAAVAEWNAAHGLDEWGSDETTKQKIEHDSAKYPEHMFKIGYLRSSYNSSGINSLLRDRTGKDLHFIFFGEEERYDYHVVPDWEACRVRALEALEAFRAYNRENGSYRVMREQCVDLGAVKNEADALRVWQEHRKRNAGQSRDGFGDWYSSREGTFTRGEPLRAVAIMVGIGEFMRLPTAYVVYEAGDEDAAWYEQALEITLEMIEWVLGQPDPEKYVLHWSS